MKLFKDIIGKLAFTLLIMAVSAVTMVIAFNTIMQHEEDECWHQGQWSSKTEYIPTNL